MAATSYRRLAGALSYRPLIDIHIVRGNRGRHEPTAGTDNGAHSGNAGRPPGQAQAGHINPMLHGCILIPVRRHGRAATRNGLACLHLRVRQRHLRVHQPEQPHGARCQHSAAPRHGSRLRHECPDDTGHAHDRSFHRRHTHNHARLLLELHIGGAALSRHGDSVPAHKDALCAQPTGEGGHIVFVRPARRLHLCVEGQAGAALPDAAGLHPEYDIAAGDVPAARIHGRDTEARRGCWRLHSRRQRLGRAADGAVHRVVRLRVPQGHDSAGVRACKLGFHTAVLLFHHPAVGVSADNAVRLYTDGIQDNERHADATARV